MSDLRTDRHQGEVCRSIHLIQCGPLNPEGRCFDKKCWLYFTRWALVNRSHKPTEPLSAVN